MKNRNEKLNLSFCTTSMLQLEIVIIVVSIFREKRTVTSVLELHKPIAVRWLAEPHATHGPVVCELFFYLTLIWVRSQVGQIERSHAIKEDNIIQVV